VCSSYFSIEIEHYNALQIREFSAPNIVTLSFISLVLIAQSFCILNCNLSTSYFKCAFVVGASSNSIVVSMFDSTVSPGLEIDLEFSLGNVGANNFELNISSWANFNVLEAIKDWWCCTKGSNIDVGSTSSSFGLKPDIFWHFRSVLKFRVGNSKDMRIN